MSISPTTITNTRLSGQQLADYDANGYLIVRQVFSLDEIAALADDVDDIAQAHAGLIDPRNMRVRFQTHHETGEQRFETFDPVADLSPVARAMTCDRRILDRLADIYGEPAELFKEKLIYKPAGANGATLHQDWISWPGFPESFLTVLVAIDPFTSENGATEFYPGLHKQGYLSPRDGQHHHLVHEELGVTPQVLLLEPGDMAIFSCFVPHRSAPNFSQASRRGYFMSFNARSDGGQQYLRHYREFHDWIRSKVSADVRDTLYFR